MELNDEIANKASAKINAKCSPYQCPMCRKQTNFIFAKAEFHYVGFNRNSTGLTLEDGQIEYFPVLTGTCSNCGFVASFNLHALGLI
jgi:hypothetical protein